MPGTGTNGSTISSVSAAIAAANSLLPNPSEPGLRFPAEDAGRSLAEIAHADLDAALQLLAERAQYITGATGAAIALRRGERHDMQCRASAGSNAPELGALLSMEYGLSGESVRTRQLLRCDDAERDPRVNRDICRELGIASVVVMPVVSDDQVLGVFELLSGKPRAFDERDLSALLRLGEMVETAVKHARVAQPASALPEIPQSQSPTNEVAPKAAEQKSNASQLTPAELTPAKLTSVPPSSAPVPEAQHPPEPEAAAAPRKPLLWSAAMRAQTTAQGKESPATLAVPPALRNLQKCQACGFPVSQGRTLCVDCEEKQWRGQRLPQPDASPQNIPVPPPESKAAIAVAEVRATFVKGSPADQPPIEVSPGSVSADITKSAPAVELVVPDALQESAPPPVEIPAEIIVQEPTPTASTVPSEATGTEDSTLFLSSAQSESWFAANKYILGVLLVVAIVLAAIAWLR
ncbi:MAG: GAF domain-containing protein [Candidatus Sulfotelmatobacter sp.]